MTTTDRLRVEIDRAATSSNLIVGAVTAVDAVAQTITVLHNGAPWTIPATLGFYPQVGSTVVITMNGDEPVILDTVLEGADPGITVAKFMRSIGYVAGASGWSINPDGDAEFNDVTVRGRADLSGVAGPLAPTSKTFETSLAGWVAQDTAKRWSFDTTTESWGNLNATLAFEPSIVYNPPGSLKVTATGATYEARSPQGTSGVAISPAGRVRVVLPVLAAKTARTMTPCIRWWTSGGAQVGADVTGTAITTDLSVWRYGIVDATAPATTAFFSVCYKFTGATDDVHYIDEAVGTSPTNATVTRSSTEKRSGAYSMRVTSIGAGLALASTPDTGPGTGYAVTAGEWWYYRQYHRQGLGNMTVVLAAFLDDAGVLIATSKLADAIVETPNTSFKLHTARWEVPVGATRMAVVTGHFATAANQHLYVDDIELKKMSTMTGGVLLSESDTSGDASQTSTKMSAYLSASERGFPYAKFNGHVFSRAMHGRLTTPSAPENITSGSWQSVRLNTVDETYGVDVGDEGVGGPRYYLVCRRTGLYFFALQVNWNGFYAATSGGIQAIAAERWLADGSAKVGGTAGRYVAQSQYQGVSAGALCQSASVPGRWNAGERLYLKAYQDHGSTLVIEASAGAIGGQQILSATYHGELV